MYQIPTNCFYTEMPTYVTPGWRYGPWHELERSKPPAFHKESSYGVFGLSEYLARL